MNPITSFPVGACVYYDRHFYGLAFYQLQLREGFSYPTAVPSESNSFASGMKVTATQRWIANTVPQPSIRYYWGSDTNSNAYPAYGNASALEADPSVNQKTITYFAGQYSPSQYSTAYSVFVEYYYVRTALGSWTWRSTWTNEIKEFRCPGTPSPATSPPPPNSPPTKMDKACCAMLSEVHQVLATREMLKGKCTFPWRLRMPGGQGEEIIKDYANFLRALAQEIDHLGIHPPKLYIQDNNNAAEGDQTVDIQYPSATSAIEAMMKQVWDDNADGDTRTNFLYRLAWMGIQNSEMTLKLSAKVHALCEAFGVETEVDTATFPVPFNTAAGVKEKNTRGQGFGKNKGEIDKSIDANTELAVERLLPDFLKCRENQVLIERFSGNKDMMDILALILTHVEKLNSK
ncbi:hypothetical protein [Microcoleus sp. PH2017_22_RUC_O_B]|uniref:hypothetical protein n=1 Tax=Microcoleus sp. PH2017_22_RUC_O_B TaxID=2798833 RepID=UPI0025DE3855|nr:hypothetical protein [Microcoleus sp. PH2017_22_RUC_O_B]